MACESDYNVNVTAFSSQTFILVDPSAAGSPEQGRLVHTVEVAPGTALADILRDGTRARQAPVPQRDRPFKDEGGEKQNGSAHRCDKPWKGAHERLRLRTADGTWDKILAEAIVRDGAW